MSGGSGISQYATTPVPDDQSVPGWRVALIIASFSIALPSFLSGAQTGMALGFRDSVLASLLAGIILCAGGCLTSIISVRSRLTTYLLVQRSFGRQGATVVNLVIAAVHYGWFGVNVSFFGSAMAAAVARVYGVQGDFTTFVIFGSVLMTVSTIFGFKMLDRLALIAVPFLGIILVLLCYYAVQTGGVVTAPAPVPPVPMSFGIALSALIGGNMLAVAAMPDLSRYIRTSRSAVVAMLLSFPVAAPILAVVAALTALATNEVDIIALVVRFGLGLPALAMLVLSCWTINGSNLYSASLSVSATFPSVRPWVFTIVGGFIGGAFALMHIIDAFIPFLLFLGLIIPPIAAIYVIDGFTKFREADAAESIRDLPAVHWPALGTWIGSVAIALLAEWAGLSLTTVPTLDATIIAAIVYFLWLRAVRR
ncbi:cytosine permease [Sphingomonas sp. Root710]|uniref:purine-cytosine permease family protein n=1 Tax=Sphingomonas sp. Root710 TaxID=1736594 RepID=UPI0006FB563B|nr:cytosine permease [Sphingomonas sp. Root710]KRB86175.1 cytosine permease [Sphingomonas sp. Root710]